MRVTDRTKCKAVRPKFSNCCNSLLSNSFFCHFLVVTRISKSSMKIFFNLGYFKANTTIIRDEVHLFMNASGPQDTKPFKPYILRFKDIHTNQLIRKFKVPAFNQGWQVLSLNKWTNRWVKDPSSNKGILVTIFRGGRGQPAVKNPFMNFPRGNGPYMILFASESVQSLLAWRFLIQNALNSVAGHTQGQQRITRDISDGQRISRSLSQQSNSSQPFDNSSPQSHSQQLINMSQQSQCKLVETDMDLTNLTNGDVNIIYPKVYKSFNCSKSCMMRPATHHSILSRNNTGIKMEQYCCKPEKHHNVIVLLMNNTTGVIEAKLFKSFVPASCMWKKQ